MALHGAAAASPNAVLLVARPEMPDARFLEAVILATRTPDGHTVGVILNRAGYGGPVMEGAAVALFKSREPPAGPAFEVLKGVFLSMHPAVVEPLRARPSSPDVRFFSGFSGWVPGQLEAELAGTAWHVLPAREEDIFRTDTTRMWMELIERTRGFRTRAGAGVHAILTR